MRASRTRARYATASTPRREQDATSSLAAHAIKNPIEVPEPEPNAFEENFAHALDTPTTIPSPRNGASASKQLRQELPWLDGQDDDEERMPLLGSEDRASALMSTSPGSPVTVIRVRQNPNPLPEPRIKAKPSLSIYLSHEVCHNSQYTRPIAEILQEVLDRYPTSQTDGEGQRVLPDGSEAELVSGCGHGRQKRHWWKRMLRA